MARSLIFLVVAAGILAGCSPQPQIHRVVKPVEQPQEVQLTIIEGKTTKQEILDVLGMPKDIGVDWNYSFKDGKRICKLSLTQEDGTIFNIILKKGEMDSLTIDFLAEKPSIVESVSVH